MNRPLSRIRQSPWVELCRSPPSVLRTSLCRLSPPILPRDSGETWPENRLEGGRRLALLPSPTNCLKIPAAHQSIQHQKRNWFVAESDYGCPSSPLWKERDVRATRPRPHPSDVPPTQCRAEHRWTHTGTD